ncbi:nucleoside recognition family protein [Mangrovicoccus algicola]|uniref:Nucleoside recognition family protein n=1 Tax=Mangrovicoccus algicola TaxID=2771008 RepID=A0A8J7CVJ9_9RHOB|nr:nucleoside recognition family protein [Mangrovicoccus algicola]MBE3638819.1 nucleoside recognition family protein [Mangrovicoccus algicola]
MEAIVGAILAAGENALYTALYIFMPLMVVLMVLLRFLEGWGVLAWLERVLARPMRPFGLGGLGTLAILQAHFVSAVAPVPVLAMMQARGHSPRRLAATYAACMAAAPANATFPLVRLGLEIGPAIAISVLGSLAAGASVQVLFGRGLPDTRGADTYGGQDPVPDRSVIGTINRGGSEALRMIAGMVPMLIITLFGVELLVLSGAIGQLESLLAAPLGALGLDRALLLPLITKMIAGNTAVVGMLMAPGATTVIAPDQLNATAAILFQSLDLAGLAIFLAALPFMAGLWKPAALGAAVGIALRIGLTALWF